MMKSNTTNCDEWSAFAVISKLTKPHFEDIDRRIHAMNKEEAIADVRMMNQHVIFGKQNSISRFEIRSVF